jgi:hypothetical protein
MTQREAAIRSLIGPCKEVYAVRRTAVDLQNRVLELKREVMDREDEISALRAENDRLRAA